MNITIVVIAVIYLLVCAGIGIWGTRRTSSTRDFFAAGKNLGMMVMAIAAFASIQSGFGVVGGTGVTFDDGLGFLAAVGILSPLGFALTWFLVGKRIFRLGRTGEIYTVGDIVERRYGSRAVRGWVAGAVALGVVGYLGTQVQAMGVVMGTIFDISPAWGAIIGLTILGAYTMGGGILAGVYTDLFQGLLMAGVSVVVFFLALDVGGGMGSITRTLQESNPELGSPFGTTPMITIGCWIFLFTLGATGQPHLLTKFLMVRDAKELRWGAFTAGFAYFLTSLMVIAVGLTALALSIRGDFPKLGSPDEALTVFLSQYTPPIVAGLVIAGLLAAIMSTGNSFLNLGAASLVRDIPRAMGFRVRRELLWSRLMTAVLLIAATLFSFYLDTLVALLGVFGWGTFAAALVPAVVLGLVWPKATKQGAVAAVVVSLAINFVLEIGAEYGLEVLPEGVVNGAFALGISILVLVVVSLATQPKKEQDQMDDELRAIVEG